MAAEWSHLPDSDVHTLQGDMWHARVSPHSSKPDGEVAFWILELKNMLHQTKKIAHFAKLEDALCEGEAAITGGETQKLYALNL